MRKKSLFILPCLLCISFLCTSCIDLFNYISIDNKGNVISHFKLTVNKAMMELAEENIDGAMFDNFVSEEKLVNEELQITASAVAIDTKDHVGTMLAIKVPKKNLYVVTEEIAFILPIMKENTFEFVFSEEIFDTEEMSDTKENPFAEMIFSDIDYKIIISKEFIKTITNSYIVNSYGDTRKVAWYDLTDSYLLEAPFEYLSKGSRLIIETE